VNADGLGGMIQFGARAEHVLGMEVLSIGRSADSKDDCLMELSGRYLFLHVALRGGWIWVSACGMDEGDQPEFLFNVGDGPAGWTTVSKFVQALERSGLKSLQERPIQLGEPGSPDCFAIS
jgi:hypothetical protein